jgi:bifunctional non-homologous end joining protein LigD
MARSPRIEPRFGGAHHAADIRNRNSSFVLDGEAVLLGIDGHSDFNGLHSRRHDAEVQFYAFDVLAIDGEDLRRLPLSMRKTNLARLLARRIDGIFLSDFEQGEIGPDLFRHACLMGLRSRLETSREQLSSGPLQSLGEGEEPAASRLRSRAAIVLKQNCAARPTDCPPEPTSALGGSRRAASTEKSLTRSGHRRFFLRCTQPSYPGAAIVSRDLGLGEKPHEAARVHQAHR